MQSKLQKTDSEVKAEIQAIMNGMPIGKLIGLEKSQRQEILQKIKKSEGVTQRQIARVTGNSLRHDNRKQKTSYLKSSRKYH